MSSHLSDFIKKQKLLTAGIVAVVVGGLVVVTGLTNASGTTRIKASTSTTNTAQTTTVDTRQPGPGELFTAADGSVNYMRSQIPANPVVDPMTANWVNLMGSNTPRMNGPQWQITVFSAANSDPLYTPSLKYAKSWGCSVGGGIHIPDYATREIPGNGDGWIVVYNRDDGTVKSIWQAKKSGSSTWSGTCGGVWRANSGGGTETKVQGVGTGAEVQAGFGFIQNSELQTGVIDHALYFTSTKTCKTGFRKPAGKTDGSITSGSCIVMGSRFQLNPSVDCNGLAGASTGEKMICVAMQQYGGYILDSGGPGPISGIGMAGDDMTDPARMPWRTPGNGMRGTRGCAPVSNTCGVVANVGLDGSTAALSHIPWNQVRFLSNWNGQ